MKPTDRRSFKALVVPFLLLCALSSLVYAGGKTLYAGLININSTGSTTATISAVSTSTLHQFTASVTFKDYSNGQEVFILTRSTNDAVLTNPHGEIVLGSVLSGSTATFTGDLTVGGTLAVTGASTFTGTADFDGGLTLAASQTIDWVAAGIAEVTTANGLVITDGSTGHQTLFASDLVSNTLILNEATPAMLQQSGGAIQIRGTQTQVRNAANTNWADCYYRRGISTATAQIEGAFVLVGNRSILWSATGFYSGYDLGLYRKNPGELQLTNGTADTSAAVGFDIGAASLLMGTAPATVTASISTISTATLHQFATAVAFEDYANGQEALVLTRSGSDTVLTNPHGSINLGSALSGSTLTLTGDLTVGGTLAVTGIVTGIAWSEVLAEDATTGANSPEISSGQAITFNTGSVTGEIAGITTAVVIKDNSATLVLYDRDETGGAQQVAIMGEGVLSVPGAGTDSVVLGPSAAAAGDRGIAIGLSSSAGQNSVAIGWSADGSVVNSVAIGNQAVAAGDGVAIGVVANAATNSIAIGRNATVGVSYAPSIVLGREAVATAQLQFVVGSRNYRVTSMWIGEGVTSIDPTDFLLAGTSTTTTETDTAGSSWVIQPGPGTGNSVASTITLKASVPTGSGTSQHALATIATITSQGLTATVDVRVGSHTLTATDSGSVFTDLDTGAQQVFALPAAIKGIKLTFVVEDSATGIVVTAAGGDTIRIAASITGGGGTVTSSAIGDTVTLIALDGTQWIAVSSLGTWTFS